MRHMKYIDSNVFIYPILLDAKSDRKAELCRNILLKIADGSISAATSAITWDEIVWVVRKTLGRDVAVREGEKFLEFPNLKLVKVDESIIRTAQKIAKKHSIKPRDAIHSACCIENGIEELLSDDSDFDRIDGIKRIPIK